MGRSILSAASLRAIGFGLGLSIACKVPDTLGLPCEIDAHCDEPQVCRSGVCAMADGDDGTSTGLAGTGSEESTSSADLSSTSDAESSSSGTTLAVSDGSSSSTGAECGLGFCTDVDILIVLDNSPSMQQWLLPLASSLNSLTALIAEKFGPVCSYHVGITTGDAMVASNPMRCQISGALLRFPASCGVAPGDPPWLSSETATLDENIETAKCALLQVGTGGSTDERMLSALLGAVDPANNAAGACNDGFRRPDANMLILFITDEDDPTPTEDLGTLADQFDTWVDGWRTAFIAVVADDPRECPWDPEGTDSDGSGAQLPSKLAGFLGLSAIPLSQQAYVDICETALYDFTDAFEVVEAACGG